MNAAYVFFILIASAPLVANDLSKPKSYTIEEFLNASNWELRAHKRQLDALEKAGELNITPSQAQLFYPDPVANRNDMEDDLQRYTKDKRILPQIPWISPRWWGGDVAGAIFSPGHTQALNRAIAHENEIYDKGGAVVYHATNPSAYAESYIRTKVENLARELQGMPVKPSKWLMLRNFRKDPRWEKQAREYYLKHGVYFNDEFPDQAANLMGCSVGLSSTQEMESALYFWLKKRSSKNVFTPAVYYSKHQYHPELEAIAWEVNKEIENLNDAINTGVLLQMAVKDPKMLNKVMYNSMAWGHKWTPAIGTKESGYRGLQTPQELIEAMRSKPSQFPKAVQMGQPQTRTIMTGDKMLNPDNPKIRKNVEFNVYADNQEALDAFQRKVDAAFDKQRIMADYKARYSRMTLPQKFWHNLQYKICKPASREAHKQIQKDSSY